MESRDTATDPAATVYGIAVTGERYVPWWANYVVAYEHLHRYLFATSFAHGKRVLDVACGEGYGTAMLGGVARWVIGADIDPATIAHASTFHCRDNVRFARADAVHLPLRRQSVDLVVSFETIEHFSSHDDFLNALKDALDESGLLLISTPDRAAYSEAGGISNPFHERELAKDEFLAALRKRFRYVQLLGQKCIVGSLLASADDAGDGALVLRPQPGPELFFTEVDPDRLEYSSLATALLRPIYYVAACSDAPLAPVATSLMLDSREMAWKSLLSYRARAQRLQVEAAQAAQRLARVEGEVKLLRRLVEQLRTKLAQAKTVQAARPDPAGEGEGGTQP